MTGPSDTVKPGENLRDFLIRRKAALSADARQEIAAVGTNLPANIVDRLTADCILIAEIGFDTGSDSVLLFIRQHMPELKEKE